MSEYQDSTAQLRAAYDGIEPDLRFRDEVPALHACRLALNALAGGGYGVGALVMSEEHRIFAEGRNHLFGDALDSAGHAEMRALDTLESLDEEHPPPCELSLLVTLEPCPMCLTRILYAGIGEVIYINADDEGGMVQRRELLPPAQRELANITRFRVAEVSEPVRELAARLSVAQLEQKRQALMAAQGRV